MPVAVADAHGDVEHANLIAIRPPGDDAGTRVDCHATWPLWQVIGKDIIVGWGVVDVGVDGEGLIYVIKIDGAGSDGGADEMRRGVAAVIGKGESEIDVGNTPIGAYE